MAAGAPSLHGPVPVLQLMPVCVSVRACSKIDFSSLFS